MAIGQAQADRESKVLEQIRTELHRQDAKWGEQNHPDGTAGRRAGRDAPRRALHLQADHRHLHERGMMPLDTSAGNVPQPPKGFVLVGGPLCGQTIHTQREIEAVVARGKAEGGAYRQTDQIVLSTGRRVLRFKHDPPPPTPTETKEP